MRDADSISLGELYESVTNKWCAVVLDEKSKKDLYEKFKDKIPNGWTVKCHHMTINPHHPIGENEVGMPIKLKVEMLGVSKKVLAAKVSGYHNKTNNSYPHVTIAVDHEAGGTSRDSNDIVHFVPIEGDLILNGKVENLLK